MIVKILIAVLIFGITVIIHELGHFLLAKANGITVTEFSIGFGPTVVKTEKGGTIYSLKLLPFGGACQMLGEDGEEEGEGTFNSKSVWARISVVAAGPVFNMILAFFCAIFVISYAGSSPARVTEVADGSPEAEAGLEAGDIITSYEGRHISIGKELNSVMTVQGVPTDEITLEVKKADGEKKTITYEPTVTTRYMMGFNYDDCDRGMEFTYVQQNMPLAAAGVVAGDLLVSINGAPITCVADFTAYQTEHPFDGSAVTLEYEHADRGLFLPELIRKLYIRIRVFNRCHHNLFRLSAVLILQRHSASIERMLCLVSSKICHTGDRRAEIQRAGDQILGAHRH